MTIELYVLEIWATDGARFSLEQRAARTVKGAETWAAERAAHEPLAAPRWAWHHELERTSEGVRFLDSERVFETDHVVIVPDEFLSELARREQKNRLNTKSRRS